MRRFLLIFACIAALIGMSVTVSAADCASQVNIYATVNQNESCQVTQTVTLHIENNDGSLTYPVPGDATAVSLNGSRVWTTRSGQVQLIDLSGALHNMTGDFTITVNYTLPDVIHTGAAGAPELQLPMLSGFVYPVSQLDFSVTLPGEITAKPAFSSGYHQANIEKDLISGVSGASVTGRSSLELKDHETLTMTLAVQEEMFPNAPLVFYESDADDLAMAICGILALMYWLVFLRCKPVLRRGVSVTAPEGVSAGELGAVMTLGRADLSLMVFSWAQLGYIRIDARRKDRVMLYKIMDMGNERTAFEQRCFKNLFAGRNSVDTTGLHYAARYKAVYKAGFRQQALVHPHSGNPNLFRGLVALISLFAGVSFGIAMTQDAAAQGFWIFVTAATGLFAGWFMQNTLRELFLRKGTKTALGLTASILWMLLSLLAAQPGIGVGVLLSQWLGGLMTFFGGRRTDAGRQELIQILGLRRYLKTVSREELQRICAVDPEYFFSMAPFALALGVDKGFARRFKKLRLPECPYLRVADQTARTAMQWTNLLRATLVSMDRRTRLRPLERIAELITKLKK